MQQYHLDRVLVAILTGILPNPFGAHAESGLVFDEVTVTAVRREISSTEISTGLSIVDGAAAERQKLVTDTLADLPGVSLQQTTPGQGAAIIRGLKGSSILHLVDGMRLNNAIFRSAPTQYFALVPVSAVERIEVVRGTPTSLYGSDAVGGMVQVVTRVPEFDAIETATAGEVHAGWDSAELARTLRGTLDVGNRFVATTVSLEYLRTGDRRVGGGERVGPSGYESKAGRLAMSIIADEQRQWLFDVHYLEQPETPRVDELVPGFGQAEPSSSEFLFAPNRRIFAHARYDRAAGPLALDWRFDLAWQRIDDDRISRNFGADERRFERNRSDLTSVSLTAARAGDGSSWIAGIEASHDSVSSSRSELDLVSGGTAELTPRFPDGASLDQAALFVNLDRTLGGGHALGGGLRFSAVQVDLPETPVSPAAKVDINDLSGDLGWRFDIDDDWQLVANLGFGFRAPNVFDLGTFGERPGNRFNVPNTALDSERVVQLDAGVRRHGERLKLELMLYALDYDDRITSVFTGMTTPDGRDIVQSANAAESRIHGVEVGASYAVTDGLQLEAVLNYARGEERNDGVTEPADRIPPLGGRLGLDYDAGGALVVSAWIRFADAQERLSSRDVGDIRIDPDGTPGWATAGAEAVWQGPGGWELMLGFDNVLDKRYREHGSGIDAPGRGVSIAARYAW